MDLRILVDSAVETVQEIWKHEKDTPSMLIMEYEVEGKPGVETIPFKWANDQEKRLKAMVLTKAMRLLDCKRFVFVSEGWALKAPPEGKRKEALMNGNLKISQCSDRVEMVMVTGQEPGRSIMATFRVGEERKLSEPEWHETKEMICNLFPVFA